MERRNFLKLALGATAGAAAFAATAQAAPLSPQPVGDAARARMPQGNSDAHPAVTTSEEAAQARPEQVHWRGRGRHWGWRHRHWGWRRRRWHRRHYW
ncbi:twin-arginine translocation (Tat) [Bradyrhizobium genosp. SA-3]|uniref:twin-arginine translocation signal domain-containing protein n=1 Tax=Bradyrhizobium genosp. SA-3 TaxID=508868 RepID=UPI00102949F6|nr:twin-arginine translocation signal domain-containing protein [Bradyrhizobium genosp. SA-3]RZM98056.1 twin-arginine translocation (Tat) [Bradyrhizobium genosp. SA-3]